MKFTKGKQKPLPKYKLALLFFQVPTENVLANITKYIETRPQVEIEYFCDQKLALIFHYAGQISAFPESFHNGPADELIVVGYPAKGSVSQEMLLSMKLSRAIIKLIPVEMDLLTGLMEVGSLNDIPHIRLFPDKMTKTHKVTKIILGKVIAVLGILFTVLLLPFIAIFIKATSPGPIFYNQKRLGKNARPFTLYKFRTMVRHAEENGPQLSGIKDLRITKAGKILRYWHLDELPQFWNILKGDMALVGPRPERPFFARFLAQKLPYYKIIYQQKPGLTSLGMIKYGYASSIEEMTDRLYYDIVYLNRPTFMMDAKILINTIQYIFLKTFYAPSEKRKEKNIENLKALTTSHDPLVRWLFFKSKIEI